MRPHEFRLGLTVIGLAALLTVGMAVAQNARSSLPWMPAGSVPLPAGVRSVEFPMHDEPLLSAPGLSAQVAQQNRRGAAQLGARLPLYAVESPGGACQNHWLMVGPMAWVCEDRVRLSTWPARPANEHATFDDGLPYAYHFVGQDGTFGYDSLNLAEEGIPDSQLEPGFAVGIRRMQHKPGGELYGLTTHDLWIPMRDLNPVQRFDFSGVTLKDGQLRHGWVATDTSYWTAPGKRPVYSQRDKVSRFTSFEVRQVSTHRGAEYIQVDEGRWLKAADVRLASPTAMPAETKPTERWIAVDTQQQTLVAYEGERPVFATLVSTGRGYGDSELATPKGQFRIWVKLLSTDMTNIEDQNASRYWAIEDVPYVMFFKGGYGLHGAFWHRSFGNRRSHGCVNLAPLDAQFLFHWAGPRLPAGWHAVLPTSHDPGTLVVVR